MGFCPSIVSILCLLVLCCICQAEYPYPSILYGYSCDQELIFDQALVQFTSNTFGYGLYATNSQCYKCASQLISSTTSSSNRCEVLYSPFYWTFTLVQTTTGDVVSSIDLKLDQHGRYMIYGDIGTRPFLSLFSLLFSLHFSPLLSTSLYFSLLIHPIIYSSHKPLTYIPTTNLYLYNL